MTQPGYITVQTQALQDNADRLGLLWKKRPATIVAPLSDDPTGVTAIMDGDTVAINVYSLIGVPAVGARVMCDIVPPSGIYVTGYIGSAPGTLVGGKLYTTSGNKVVGVSNVELIPTDYTITITEPYNRLLRIDCSYRSFTSVSGDTFFFRIRKDSLTGEIVGEDVRFYPSNAFGYQFELEAYVIGSGKAQTYVMTCQRIGGSGLLTIGVDGDMNNQFVVTDVGNIANVTQV